MRNADLHDDIDQMLRVQLRRRGIRDRRVLAAMAKVPRERFVPESSRREAYADRALAIDCGQTISQPYIVGLMTQALKLSGDEKVLEIGTGSGYQTAILAELAAEVVSIERYPELSQQAGEVLSALGYENVTLSVGDGTLGCAAGSEGRCAAGSEGRCAAGSDGRCADRAPFERIIVTAAGAECPPTLLAQLAEQGILVMPLGGRDYQTLQAIRKVDGQPQSENLSACRFVPLVGVHGWPG